MRMTEERWRAAKPYPTDLQAAAAFAAGRASDRRVRLYAAACCRVAWGRLPDERYRAAVGVAEAYADGAAGEAERIAARFAAEEVVGRDARGRITGPADQATLWAAYAIDGLMAEPAAEGVEDAVGFAARLAGAAGPAVCEARLRDVFGDPFRPVTPDPAWRSSTAVALAGAMYGARDFSALPILADALQDAGCENGEVLDHCRGPGPHVRGCWVVDMVLGKT